MLILFLDESGDHSLDKIDIQYPIFVLGGCLIDLDYHEKILSPKFKEFKQTFFGSDDIIIHTAEITRRKGIFQKLTDKSFRESFYNATNRIMEEFDYQIVACAINKNSHLKQYGLAAIDPYMLSLRILVERFVFAVKEKGSEIGHIVAESRGELLDNELRLAWMDLRTRGTEYISASEVRKYIAELHIRDKKKNIAGLQLADLVVSPIGRYVLGKEPKQDWYTLEKKFRKNSIGNYKGYGLVVLPK